MALHMKMNVHKLAVLGLLLATALMVNGQAVGINTDGTSPDASAILDIQSADKGILIPRMTSAERAAIPSPADGLLVYDLNSRSIWQCHNGAWSDISAQRRIIDSDGDTKVQVEESVDEDMIRFDVEGNEVMILRRNTEGAVCLELADQSHSTLIGMEAGASNASALGSNGDENSFIGYRAGYSNTTGRFNTFLGSQAGHNTTNGDQNTAIGFLSLKSNLVGSQNSALGSQSLYSNTNGLANTATGFQALYSNTTGDQNSALGNLALQNNSVGSQNTAVGSQALGANVSGTRNAAVGYQALYLNSNGFQNSAFGSKALYSNTGGDKNTASGYQAMYSNTTGSGNIAMGYQALYSNTTGNPNTAVGDRALRQNSTGDQNTAVGYLAAYSNTTGIGNTAVGNETIYAGTTTQYNTAMGYHALHTVTTQEHNTGLGAFAGANYSSTQSTYVGSGAYPNNNGYTNTMGLGFNARPTASNQVRIGNALVSSIGGYAPWTTISDGRFKSAVQDNVPGLDFIQHLRPVTYHLDVNALAAALGEDSDIDAKGNLVSRTPDAETVQSRNVKSAIRYSGFIAQEVQSAAATLGYDFSGVEIPENESGFYGLRYSEFVVPLVKAVQELSEQADEQRQLTSATQAENNALRAELTELTAKMQQFENQIELLTHEQAH